MTIDMKKVLHLGAFCLFIFLFFATAFTSGGCRTLPHDIYEQSKHEFHNQNSQEADYNNEAVAGARTVTNFSQLNNGLIWMFPGVFNVGSFYRPAVRAMRDLGVNSEILKYEWPLTMCGLINLMNHKKNREEAARVATEIVKYSREYPGRPIDLVGYSGGAYVAVAVAESLPDDVKLRHVIMVHPAISCTYDLSNALHHINGKIINYYSRRDWLILGVGTLIFGTMDRGNTISAGNKGFQADMALSDISLRSRLEQHELNKKILGGGHLTINSYKSHKEHIAVNLLSNH